jgi:hypothetical protein
MRLRNDVYLPRLEKMAYLFLMDGIARKKLPARAGVLSGNWHWPSLPTADAFRDDKSDVEAMRAGLTTRTAIIAKNGDGTFEDVLARGTQEAIAIEMATQDANRELVRRGYKPSVADLNIAQDTANPTQQPEPAPEANKPQGEAPANATAALAFDESNHPRADDGEFGSGGGGSDDDEGRLPQSEIDKQKTTYSNPHAEKYNPSASVVKAGGKWGFTQIDGKQSKKTFGTKGEAQAAAYDHKKKNADSDIEAPSEPEKKEGYDPESSVVKYGDKWTYKTSEGNDGKILRDSRAEALNDAKAHKDFLDGAKKEAASPNEPAAKGGGGKAEEMGAGADGKQKPVLQMSKGEKKTHDMRKKLEALRAKNAEGAKKLADTNTRVSELHSQLVEQLKAGTGTANDDLKKTVNELGAKIAETKMHTQTIQHALRGEDIAADEHGQDSPEHETARKRTEYVAEKAK